MSSTILPGDITPEQLSEQANTTAHKIVRLAQDYVRQHHEKIPEEELPDCQAIQSFTWKYPHDPKATVKVVPRTSKYYFGCNAKLAIEQLYENPDDRQPALLAIPDYVWQGIRKELDLADHFLLGYLRTMSGIKQLTL